MRFGNIAFLLLSIPMICYGSSHTEGHANILGNPDCEDGTEFWGRRSCEISSVTSPVHSGTRSIKATGRDSAWQGIRQSIYGKVVEGETYKISGWVRLDNSPNDVVAISVEQQDDRGTQYIHVGSVQANDKEWVQITGEFTLKVEGGLSVLDLYFEGPAPGVNFYIDDVNMFGPKVLTEKAEAAPTATAKIDAGTRRQVIEGLGASGAFYTKALLTQNNKTKLYELLFKDLAIDIFRIRNTHEINLTDFNDSVEIVKQAQAHLPNLKLMITPWTPPAYLKSTDSVIGGTLKKIDGKFAYEQYAQWWYESLKAYEKQGIKFDYMTLQNEPDFAANYDSCVFAATEDANNAGYNYAQEAVWKKLNAEMGSDMPKMLDPDSMGFTNLENYIRNFKSHEYSYGYAHHLYGCTGCAEDPDRYIPLMLRFKEFNAKYGNNKPMFQTEFEDKPDTWTGAMNTAILMHNSLAIQEVAGYLYWDLFWTVGSGLISITDTDNYIIMPAYYAFKQFSAFIHSGWQRVEAASDNSGLRISVYISPDGKKLTAVLINTSPKTDIETELMFKDFAVSEGEIYRSSESENCVLVGSYEPCGKVNLPAYSITTIVLSAKN
ncbi:MAG: carbohydrate binding domain-containing protein [Phycisphaerae bacterium]